MHQHFHQEREEDQDFDRHSVFYGPGSETDIHQTSFFHYVTTTYGRNTTNILKEWRQLKFNFLRLSLQLTFLLRCRTHDIVPNNILNATRQLERISWHSDSCKRNFKTTNFKLSKKLLNYEIKDTFCQKNFLKNCIQRTYIKIHTENLTTNERITFFNSVKLKLKRIKISLTGKFDSKFERLLQRFGPPNVTDSSNNNVNIICTFKNLSSTEIPDKIRKIVSLGRNFLKKINHSQKKTFYVRLRI